MRCSVLIPSWRRPTELERCLSALEEQALPPSEVVVVVREGDTETRAVVEGRSNGSLPVRPVTVGVPGVAAALEAGRREARGEVIAITDDDAVPSADWLARIAEHLRSDPSLGAVGGRDRFDGKDFPTSREHVGEVRWYGRRVGEHHRGVGGPRPVDVLKGVNIALRRAAIEPVGFDQRLRGSGMQLHWEVGLCLAVKRAGWKLLYDPGIAVDHYEATRFGPDQRGLPDLGELRGTVHNEMYGMVRWLPWWRKPVVLAYGLLVGTRETPGLAIALERVMRTGRPGLTLRRLGAATRGRLDALGTYARALRGR